MKISESDFATIKTLAGDAKMVVTLIGDRNNVRNPANAAFFLKKILSNLEDPEYIEQLREVLKTLKSAGDLPMMHKGGGNVFVGGSVSPGTVIVTGNGNVL
jgi:hypothetical protein